ncbi:WD40 repeat domain-containing protein [Catellatospora sp. TT07R-123]|uniref:WD40 repeat domain-containing protein n=1 Tax=Catellatospora sp. TT07R-123 TaxID=2733863 RepID=UPI001BB35D58|nr:hypothetical protein [Catellatospora sp. TT07R-123]
MTVTAHGQYPSAADTPGRAGGRSRLLAAIGGAVVLAALVAGCGSGKDAPQTAAPAPSSTLSAVPHEIGRIEADSQYFGYDPKTGYLAVCDQPTLKILDISQLDQPREIAGFGNGCLGRITWFSSAKRLISVDGVVVVVDVADPRQPRQLDQVSGWLMPVDGAMALTRDAVFNPSGSVLAVAESGGVMLHPGGLDGTPKTLFKGRDALALAFHPAGRTLAAGIKGGDVVLWDVRSAGSARKTATLHGHRGLVQTITFSPDGSLMATGGADQTVIVWNTADLAKPVKLATLDMHEGTVLSLAFDSSGKTLAAGTAFGTATLWNLTDPAAPAKGAVLKSGYTQEAYAVLFRADGTLIVGGNGGSRDYLVFWEIPGLA